MLIAKFNRYIEQFSPLEVNPKALGSLINNIFAAFNKQFHLQGYPLFTFLFTHITCICIFLYLYLW